MIFSIYLASSFRFFIFSISSGVFLTWWKKHTTPSVSKVNRTTLFILEIPSFHFISNASTIKTQNIGPQCILVGHLNCIVTLDKVQWSWSPLWYVLPIDLRVCQNKIYVSSGKGQIIKCIIMKQKILSRDFS